MEPDLDYLLKAVRRINPDVDGSLIEKAYRFSQKVHKHHRRDEGTPYFHHPFRVALFLAEKMNEGAPEIIAAALLHDVIEDCKEVTRDKVARLFGERAAELVQWLSKPDRTDEITPKERNAIYYRQLEEAPDEAIKIKISDRLDNLRTLHLSPDTRKQYRYARATYKHLLPTAKRQYPEVAEEMENILSKYDERITPRD